MKKINRNHFIVIIDKSISNFLKDFWFLIVLVLAKNNTKIDISLKLLGIIIFFIIIVLYQTLAWYKNTYEIKDNIITVSNGVFEKKIKEIPFNKIQTINICEGVKHRIFGLSVLKVDTGNSTLEESELSFVMKKCEAENFKQIISQFKNYDYDENNTEQINLKKVDKNDMKKFNVSDKELFLLSLTSGNILAGIFFLCAIINFVNDYLKRFFGEYAEDIKNSMKGINFKDIPISKIAYIIILIVLIYFIFSLMISIISNFIKFYKFSVERQNKDLIINYGMLNKKNYIIPVEKISALYIKQNIIKQALGLQELHIESIGYGNESGETSMLYPIANELKKQEIIKELIPEFEFNEDIIKSPKRTLRRFIISNLIFPSIICVILTLKFKYGYLSIVTLFIFVLKGYLEYRNSGIGINSRLICLSNKGFYKTRTIIPKKKVQSVTIKTSYIQRKSCIFDFIICIQGNDFGKEMKVKNLSRELKSKLDTFSNIY